MISATTTINNKFNSKKYICARFCWVKKNDFEFFLFGEFWRVEFAQQQQQQQVKYFIYFEQFTNLWCGVCFIYFLTFRNYITSSTQINGTKFRSILLCDPWTTKWYFFFIFCYRFYLFNLTTTTTIDKRLKTFDRSRSINWSQSQWGISLILMILWAIEFDFFIKFIKWRSVDCALGLLLSF